MLVRFENRILIAVISSQVSDSHWYMDLVEGKVRQVQLPKCL